MRYVSFCVCVGGGYHVRRRTYRDEEGGDNVGEWGLDAHLVLEGRAGEGAAGGVGLERVGGWVGG